MQRTVCAALCAGVASGKYSVLNEIVITLASRPSITDIYLGLTLYVLSLKNKTVMTKSSIFPIYVFGNPLTDNLKNWKYK